MSQMNWTPTIESIQTYQPGFTVQNFDNLLASVPLDTNSLNTAIATLQSGGLTGATAQTVGIFQNLQTSNYSNCEKAAFAITGLSTIFATIAAMLMLPEAILAMSMWGPLANWGGLITTVMGIIATAICS